MPRVAVHHLTRAWWLAVYLVLLAAPTGLWLVTAPSAPLWNRLATLTGLLAASALVCATVLPSRLRSLNRAFGIEGVLNVHRFLGTTTASLVFVHLAAVIAENPRNVALLDPTSASLAARCALVATAALVATTVASVLRSRIRWTYELWRWLHLTLAVATLLFTGLHIYLLHQLATNRAMAPLLAMLAVLVVATLVFRWLWRSPFDAPTQFVVREVRHEGPTVSTLVLVPRAGQHSWTFAPGQFAWLRLRRSVSAQEHPFTVASSAHAATTEFTIRHTGDFTRALSRLAPGAPVWVDGPHGAFTNEGADGTACAMIAGGIGITPMMSMLRTAADRADTRQYHLLVVVNDPRDLLFRAELAALRRRLDLNVTEVLRRPAEGWAGRTGEIAVSVLQFVLAHAEHPTRVDYYVCGPPGLVNSAVATITSAGVASTRVHTELFDLK